MTMIIDGTNGGFFPSWTTSTRPASPAVGQMGYNTTTGKFDQYTASGWSSVGSENQTGSVVQVVNATLTPTTLVTTTGGPSGLPDIGLSASITPASTSNKILVLVTVPALLTYSGSPSNNGAYGAGIQICNGSNTILYDALGDGGGILDFWAQNPGPGVNGFIFNKQFLHSPATTSSYTYKIKAGVRNDSGVTMALRINYDSTGSSWKPFCSLTLLEVTG